METKPIVCKAECTITKDGKEIPKSTILIPYNAILGFIKTENPYSITPILKADFIAELKENGITKVEPKNIIDTSFNGLICNLN